MPRVWNLTDEPMPVGSITIAPKSSAVMNAKGLANLTTKYPRTAFCIGEGNPFEERIVSIKEVAPKPKPKPEKKEEPSPTMEEIDKASKKRLLKWADRFKLNLDGSPTKKEIIEALKQHLYPVGDDGAV